MGLRSVPHQSAGVAGIVTQTFTDSGSVTLSTNGVWVIEVLDSGDVVLGGAVAAIGAGWASVLASAGQSSPAPAFTALTSSVRVALSGGSGGTIRVLSRRLCANGALQQVLT